MREYKILCEVFEKAIKKRFLMKLGINKDDIKNPDVGAITKALNDAGTVTSIILGLGVGATIALSIGSFGVGSIVGATVTGITFTVSKVDKKMKKSEAIKLDKKVEIYIHSHLKCIIMDVAKELSRMFEYQVLELKDRAEIDTLAEYAVDLMSDLKKHDTFDRNTLIKKILQDGKMKEKPLLTRNGDKWSAPDVFRKPGLQRTILGTVRAEFIYQVKPNGACDTRKYGYRGQFLELKKYGGINEENEKIPEMRNRKNPATDETSTREDPCEELCNECSFNYKNCTSGKYFSESDIDAQYTETREEHSPYHPIHILVQCSKFLETFIGNPLQEEKPSLANYLKKKLSLPENHVVHPVYRQHCPGKVPDLQKSDLTGSDFSHSDFTNSSLKECHFSKCVMLFVNLEKAKMSGSRFCDTLISHSNLQDVEADHCEWTKTSLLCSIVDGAYLDSAGPSIGGNCLDGTNISVAITGEKRKLNCNESKYVRTFYPVLFIRWRTRQSKGLPPLRSWVRFSLRTHDTYVKRVSQRSTESRGFSPGTPVSSYRECCMAGWVRP